MTTNNSPREITELMQMGTYQGMTDEEINILIDYKIQQALNTDEQQARRDAAADISREAAECTQRASIMVADMVKSIKDCKPNLIRITGANNG